MQHTHGSVGSATRLGQPAPVDRKPRVRIITHATSVRLGHTVHARCTLVRFHTACFRFSLAQTSSISRSQADGLSGSGFAATGSAPRSAALGASPLPPLSRTRCVFCCAPMSSSPAYSPLLSVQAFRHNHRPTMPSADSCTAINNPCGLFSPDSRTPDRPPEGKHSRLHHTPARSTTQILDGHGLRNHVLARPAW